MGAAVLIGALACAPAAGASTFHDGAGLRVTAVRQIDPRLVALSFKTAARPGLVSVYVLLPPGYASHPRRRFPVLYLLHGTSGGASDWTIKGNAENVIGKRELITVMPDIALNDGGGGWCTNWPDGVQRWERFHIAQVIPWIDSNLRTIPTRSARAIAGLSQGGFCSMSYAARHPDVFSVALGYSAAPDIYHEADARLGALTIINATEVALDGVPPNTFFGNPVTDGINWAAHDPATLAENLRWTRMYMYWGNGLSGPYDTPTSILGGIPIEGLVWRDNRDFQARLHSLGIPAYFDDYGPGTHTWPYWTRDLAWSIDKIMADFAHPARNRFPFTYSSAEDQYSVYRWKVSMHRTAPEFSTLKDAGHWRFSLAGSGSATVLTPPVYQRGARYIVELSGDQVARHTLVLTARPGRRLKLEVPLGPANPSQQDTVQALVAGTKVYTTTIRISRSPVRVVDPAQSE